MKNFLTFRQLDSICLKKVGLKENDLMQQVRILSINNKLYKMYREIDGINDPFFAKQYLISNAADVYFFGDAYFPLGAIDPTLHTITSTTRQWRVGDVFTASFWNATTGARISDFIAVVTATSGGNLVGTYNVIYGSDAGSTLTGSRYTVIVPGGMSTLTFSISGLYIKDVVRIYDNAYTGGLTRYFREIKDPKIWSTIHRDPTFSGEVAWFQRGESIDLFVGSTAAALGTAWMAYRGKPALCTDLDTDVLIDFPPEENQLLIDEVTAEYAAQAGKPVPADVADRLQEYQMKIGAKATDEQTKEAPKGQRGG